MGFLTAALFFSALIFAFGAKSGTRVSVCVVIFLAILFSLLGK